MSPISSPRHPPVIIMITMVLVCQGVLEFALAAFALARGDWLAPVGAGASLAWGLLGCLFAWGVWRCKRWSFWLVVLLQLLLLRAATVALLEMLLSRGAMLLTVIGDVLIPTTVLLLFWRNRLIHTLLLSRGR